MSASIVHALAEALLLNDALEDSFVLFRHAVPVPAPGLSTRQLARPGLKFRDATGGPPFLGNIGRAMSITGTLLNCDEAVRFIDQIPDPATKNNPHFRDPHFRLSYHWLQPSPQSDRLFSP